MVKYRHHCQSKWGSWGKRPVQEGPSVEDYEQATATKTEDFEDTTKRNLEGEGHHGHHGHHGGHGGHGHHGGHGGHGHHGGHGGHGHHKEHRGPPTSVTISLAFLYLVLGAQFWFMGTLKNALEEVKRLTPEEPKEAPKVEQAPIIVSAPVVT